MRKSMQSRDTERERVRHSNEFRADFWWETNKHNTNEIEQWIEHTLHRYRRHSLKIIITWRCAVLFCSVQCCAVLTFQASFVVLHYNFRIYILPKNHFKIEQVFFIQRERLNVKPSSICLCIFSALKSFFQSILWARTNPLVYTSPRHSSSISFQK